MKRSIVTALLAYALAALAPDVVAQDHDAHRHASLSAVSGSESDGRGLAAQLEMVRRSTARYRDVEVAQADGYVRFGQDEAPLMGEHWFRRDLVERRLNLERPSTLQYAVIDGDRVLVGVAYTVYQRPGEALPDGFAGSGDVWHVHDVPRIMRAIAADRPLLRWVVERRIRRGRVGAGDGRTRLAMVHAWVWLRNPDGVFAVHHRALPYHQAGLPGAWADDADEAAARGIALLTASGCEREVRSLARIAGADRDQRGAVRDACEAARERVQRAVESGPTATTVNAEASLAWSDYAARRDSLLSPSQRIRLASMVEHDGHPH